MLTISSVNGILFQILISVAVLAPHCSLCTSPSTCPPLSLSLQAAKVSDLTLSVWTNLLSASAQTQLANPFYDSHHPAVLYPTFSPKKIVLWADYWLRFAVHETEHQDAGEARDTGLALT